MKLYQKIASALETIQRLDNQENQTPQTREQVYRWEEHLFALEKELPSGSGFDEGCRIVTQDSHGEKIVITANFHHMNDNGYYIGWSNHNVVITPSLANGFNLKVTGRDRRQIKDYIGDTFSEILDRDCDLYVNVK